MKVYHKIPNVWLRNPETGYKTLIQDAWTNPEIEYLRYSKWVFTEKVDGTNIRVMWDGETVTFGGKTDRAQIPAPLVNRLKERFTPEKMAAQFGEEGEVCLYGEGYGQKIQNGHTYIPNAQDFVLFDVRIGMCWLARESVENIAYKLIEDAPGGLREVPVIGTSNLSAGITFVRKGFKSAWGDFPAEGLVARPLVEMLNRRGNRIICKIKCSDFRRG